MDKKSTSSSLSLCPHFPLSTSFSSCPRAPEPRRHGRRLVVVRDLPGRIAATKRYASSSSTSSPKHASRGAVNRRESKFSSLSPNLRCRRFRRHRPPSVVAEHTHASRVSTRALPSPLPSLSRTVSPALLPCSPACRRRAYARVLSLPERNERNKMLKTCANFQIS
jgi:hypothetical protein